MTAPPPEFSHIVRVESIGDSPRTIQIEANEAERKALATRFALAGIDALDGTVTLSRSPRGIAATGRIRAKIVQHCVATGEPVPEAIDAPFALLFVESLGEAEEVELDADDLDIVDYAGGDLDIGEALAQTLAVSMTPFPRAPDADAALRAAGVISEEEAGPFGALTGLKAAMEKGN